jgi:hypothetical protein
MSSMNALGAQPPRLLLDCENFLDIDESSIRYQPIRYLKKYYTCTCSRKESSHTYNHSLQAINNMLFKLSLLALPLYTILIIL